MRKEQLIEFCDKNKIIYPSNPSIETLNRLIVRAWLHNKEVKQSSCYGFWQNEDANCATCDFEENCFKASIGIDKKKYFKSLDNNRIRLVKTMRRK